MPAWLIPALKAVIPHLGTIVSAAAPAFTRKTAESAATHATLLQQQVTELQAAASANDAHIKALAAQIKTAVEALEAGVALAERRYLRMQVYAIAAMVLSVAALGAALFVLVVR